MDGREGSQWGIDAEDCRLPLEQANVTRDVMYISFYIMSLLYRTPAGLPDVPYFFGLLVIPCPIQHYLPTACLCKLAHEEARRRLPKEEGSARAWKCTMQLAASGRTIGGTQVGFEHSLDGGTGRGCVTDAVIYAPACVEARPRPPGGGMSQIRDGTQVPAVFFGADCP